MELATPDPVAPSPFIPSVEMSFHHDRMSPFNPMQIPSEDSSDEEPASRRGSKVVVSVDLERPRTNDSISSKCSLPPLPSTPTSVVAQLQSDGNKSANKRVKWKLRKNSTSSKNKIHQKQAQPMNMSRDISNSVLMNFSLMDEISTLPESTEPFRPKSAKSTLGEVVHFSKSSQQGPGSKLMFFIHGVGGSLNIWKHQINHFSEIGFEVLAVDLVGHGGSSAPSSSKAYRFKTIRLDLLRIFDRYSKDINIIVAHSYGTCFAAVLARERPDKVSHLIFFSSGAPVPLSPDLGPFCLPPCVIGALRRLLNVNFRKLAFAAKPTKQDMKMSFGVSSRVLKEMLKGQDWAEGDTGYHRQIRSQTLLIYGNEDGLVSLAEMQDMRRAIPDAHLEVVENASHMLMLEVPTQVNHLMEEFVQLPTLSADREVATTTSRRASHRKLSTISRTMPKIPFFSTS